jgi:hypothetical protein
MVDKHNLGTVKVYSEGGYKEPADGSRPVIDVRLRIRNTSDAPIRLSLAQTDLDLDTDTGNLIIYHAFLIAPGALITEDVREWLARTGLFRYINTTGSDTAGHCVLDCRVNAIYGDYRVRGACWADVDLGFVLLRDVSLGSEVVLNKTYHQEVSCTTDSVDSLVQGWSMALRHILMAFEAELKNAPLEAVPAG